MKQKHPFQASFFVIGLIVVLGLSSCTSFKLVSQRPSAAHPVDAVTSATSGDDASPTPAAEKAPANPVGTDAASAGSTSE